ncbi:hypothetical protein BOTBODRAFT_646485 [Botryobasidium botryosum FD-172 SS1]|uniref:Ferritin-like domain-containing protein n=1 Tax=Botryobasidium botryosum (strain FD-172 SS1) TaxID=930990 RepID=A0A067MP26_BOTB1|nr:hypothetical protein BOTBODRAFT_646485 [Botryobasidium botryosum FD-172 SS1]
MRPSLAETTVLNYLLTLEYLTNALHQSGLARFPSTAFTAAGLIADARGRFQQISDHETLHISFLKSAIGNGATAPCTYTFNLTDPQSFVKTSILLKESSVAMYIGAIPLLTNATNVALASSILAVQARHSAWASAAVVQQTPWSGGFDAQLSLNEGYSLIAPYISKCPPTNPNLGLKTYPPLSASSLVKPATTANGTTATSTTTQNLTSSAFMMSLGPIGTRSEHGRRAPNYLALLSGRSTVYVPINADNTVSVPNNLTGTVFGVVTTTTAPVSNGTAAGFGVSDENVLAGPAILQFPVYAWQRQL